MSRTGLTQRRVNGLRQLRRNAFHSAQVLHTGIGHATHTAKALQKFGPLFRTHAWNLFQAAGARAHLGAFGPHPRDGKAVRLVTDLRHQHQGGGVLAQRQLGAAIGKHQFFQAHFAALAFFHAHQAG